MQLKKIKTYHLFWFVGLLNLLIGLVNNGPDDTLDINVHDTYFVIAHLHVAIVLFLFYFLNGVGYWAIQSVFKKKLEKSLTLIHTVIVIGSFVFYWLLILFTSVFLTHSNFILSYDVSYIINMVVVYEFILIIFVAIPAYITNILIGIFRKNTP